MIFGSRFQLEKLPFAFELMDVSVNCIWLFLGSVATQMDFFFFLHSLPPLQKESLGCVNMCACTEWAGQAGEVCGMHVN